MRDGCLRVNVVVFLLNALCARFRYNNILMKMEHHGWVKQSLFLVIILVRRWDSCTSEVNAASLLHQYTEWLTAQMPAGQPGCGGNGSLLCCNEQQAVQVVEEAGAFCVWNSFYCFSLLFFFFGSTSSHQRRLFAEMQNTATQERWLKKHTTEHRRDRFNRLRYFRVNVDDVIDFFVSFNVGWLVMRWHPLGGGTECRTD